MHGIVFSGRIDAWDSRSSARPRILRQIVCRLAI